MIRRLLALSLLTACNGGPGGRSLPGPDTGTADPDTDADTDTSPGGPIGFIGGPCTRDADCAYDGGVCLTEADGFPGGTCSLPCDRLCPDADGYPVTFCVGDDDLPEDVFASRGACLSRCDFGAFPDTGCRTGYGCAVAAREGEPDTLRYVCLPDTPPDLSDCHLALAARGVPFEPTVRPDTAPATHPDLTCHVEDPVLLRPPIHGVALTYFDGTPTPAVLMSCEGAHATVDTIDDLQIRGIVEILHMGTYNCRVIAGTNTLSRHAYGDALDVYGVVLDDGARYTLVDDWRHDAHPPPADDVAARFLYDAAYRWYGDRIWNIVLTPNYNAAHDNHLHVDLTPGAHTIRSATAVDPSGGAGCGGPAFDLAP